MHLIRDTRLVSAFDRHQIITPGRNIKVLLAVHIIVLLAVTLSGSREGAIYPGGPESSCFQAIGAETKISVLTCAPGVHGELTVFIHITSALLA
jgi:hypothetical protein